MDILKHLILGALLLTAGKMVGQASTASNVATGVNDFLGWNNTFPTNDFPLRIRHDLNQPIEWYTDAVQRMRLMPTLTGQTVNTYTGLDLSGHLGLGGPVPTRPLAYIHINSSGNFFAGYRPWMRVGITFTGNSDQAYIGQKCAGA